jgi:hypothetical protein
MLHRLFGHMKQNVVAWLALFVALGGTGAYAANTIRSSDIVDNEVYTSDVRDDTLSFGGLYHQDLAANSVRSSEIASGAVGSSEVVDNSLGSLDVYEESMLFNNTLNANDIGSDAVNSAEIASSAVGSAEVADSSLNDEDVGERTFVNFTANIGTVPAQDCVDRYVTGAGGFGDHLVLTANWQDSNSNLDYTPQHSALTGNPSQDAVAIHVCNPTASPIDDANTRFNLLVIDAQ